MIDFEHVSKNYGGPVDAVADFTLHIEEGEFCVLIGPSGCGKSTTLKMINRLIEHTSGRILFAGQEIRSFAPEDLRRRMGYAIQSIGLFPHWTVERNIATVPTLLGWPKPRVQDRVTELMQLLQLDERFRRVFPHELSGGQQQRVGVARALAGDPAVLLMDEPFGALDPITREALQSELARIHKVSGKTIVLVTHDIDEALRLATRIVLMREGHIVQAATPRDLLRAPASPFVVDFLGGEDIGLRLLAVETVADRMRPETPVTNGAGPKIPLDATLRRALSLMVASGAETAAVADNEGHLVGNLHVADIVRPS